MGKNIRRIAVIAAGAALAGGAVVGAGSSAQAAEAGALAAPAAAAPAGFAETPNRPWGHRSWVAGRYSNKWACEAAGRRGERRHQWRSYDCDVRWGGHRGGRDHGRGHGNDRFGNDRHAVWVLTVRG